MRNKNDVARIIGVVMNFLPAYQIKGETMRQMIVSIARESGVNDDIPVTLPARVYSDTIFSGDRLMIEGSLRSHNNNGKLILTIFAESAFNCNDKAVKNLNFNYVRLDGFICKKPVYRKTPLGRDITDVMVAVNHGYNKSSYIPTIVWGRNAKYASELDIGTHIIVEGRFQSREYKKHLSDGEYENRVAYELSASSIEEVQDDDREENNYVEQ